MEGSKKRKVILFFLPFLFVPGFLTFADVFDSCFTISARPAGNLFLEKLSSDHIQVSFQVNPKLSRPKNPVLNALMLEYKKARLIQSSA